MGDLDKLFGAIDELIPLSPAEVNSKLDAALAGCVVLATVLRAMVMKESPKRRAEIVATLEAVAELPNAQRNPKIAEQVAVWRKALTPEEESAPVEKVSG